MTPTEKTTETGKDKDIKIKKGGWQITIPAAILLGAIGLLVGNRVIPPSESQSPQYIQQLQEKSERHEERILVLEKIGFQNRTLIESMKYELTDLKNVNEKAHNRIEDKLDAIIKGLGRIPK